MKRKYIRIYSWKYKLWITKEYIFANRWPWRFRVREFVKILLAGCDQSNIRNPAHISYKEENMKERGKWGKSGKYLVLRRSNFWPWNAKWFSSVSSQRKEKKETAIYIKSSSSSSSSPSPSSSSLSSSSSSSSFSSSLSSWSSSSSSSLPLSSSS